MSWNRNRRSAAGGSTTKSKRPPADAGASWLKFSYAAVRTLEDDFTHELNVASFAWADCRGAVEVADGVTYLTKPAAGSANPRFCCGVGRASAANRPYARGQVDTVEEVEEVRPELDLDSLGNGDVLDEREIYIAETGAVEFVSRKVVCSARASRTSRRAERGRVPPLYAEAWIKLMADPRVRLTNQVEAQSAFVRGLPGVEVHHAADLPVIESAL